MNVSFVAKDVVWLGQCHFVNIKFDLIQLTNSYSFYYVIF